MSYHANTKLKLNFNFFYIFNNQLWVQKIWQMPNFLIMRHNFVCNIVIDTEDNSNNFKKDEI